MPSQYLIQITPWHSHKNQLKKIRETVFIQEQNVPSELEWDSLDEEALHVLAEMLPAHKEQGKKLAIGTARIIINNKLAHIGRMAVLPEWRAQGIGSKILRCCIDECKNPTNHPPIETIVLNAQVYVTEFYKKAGFKITSEEFLDAGIPHKQMTLFL
ncbi:MAG: GNAT family N-acetyltransferase [Gammaproteobacteria bacterium]|nr:GNAT family N-acetyltransferase [Gammaproteobacteria bacterium]